MTMTEQDFDNATPLYFNIRLSGLRRLQASAERMQWERVRWQTAILLNPHTKNQVKPTDLIVFPWEKVTNVFEWMEKNKHVYDKLTLN